MKYKKGDYVREDNFNQAQCICADDDVAIFAPVIKNQEGNTKVMYVGLFAYSQLDVVETPPTISYDELEVF